MVRVLVVSAHPLFGQGLEAWLRQQQGLDVVGCEPEIDSIDERVQQLKPDVIIIDTSSWPGSPATALMRFLASRPGTKIVGINFQDNSVCIFGTQHAIDPVRQLLEAMIDQSSAEGPTARDSEARHS